MQPVTAIGQILNGVTPPSLKQPNATALSTWEKVKSLNFGTDLVFLNNRLETHFDIYSRKVDGMLAPGQALPNVFGTNVPQTNAGNMKTNGFELKISWKDVTKLAGSDFSYNVTVSLADSKAWITKWPNPTKLLNFVSPNKGGTNAANFGYDVSNPQSLYHYAGQRVGEIWGLDQDGYFLSDADAKALDYSAVGTDDDGYAFRMGDLKFRDRNHDGKVNFGDMTVGNPGDARIIGNNAPRFPFAIDLSGAWKGFDLRVFFQGVGKRDWYAKGSNIYFWGVFVQPWTNVTTQNMNRWTVDKPSQSAYFPRLEAYEAEDTGESLGIPNTKYLQNAAYIRCKNITLGYTLPASLLRKWKINRVRFYVSGENLFEYTKLKVHLDPEALDVNNGAIYPFQRTYAFGLNLNF